MRKLASIQKIDKILEHPNADKLEIAVVNGWKTIIKKDEFKVGDLIIYCEIDSWIPHEVAPFLTRGSDEPKEYGGIKGQRLRTIKLRGHISQGLVLPLSTLKNSDYTVGDDVTEELGIIKWERPQPASLSGDTKGNFPSYIRKTNQERCLSGDTIIKTSEGEMTIKEIVDMKYNGMVLSYNPFTDKDEYNRVNNHSVVEKSNQQWFLLELEDGSTLKLTGNHLVWMPMLGCYRRADELSLNDFIKKTD